MVIFQHLVLKTWNLLKMSEIHKIFWPDLAALSLHSLLQRDIIIEIFYERHLDYLVDVIASSCPPRSLSRSTSNSVRVGGNAEGHRIKPEILLNVCELLCFCVVHHHYRIKYYSVQTSSIIPWYFYDFYMHVSKCLLILCRCNFLMNNAIEKILTLTRRREKFLVVAAVRFMRTIISRNVRFMDFEFFLFTLLENWKFPWSYALSWLKCSSMYPSSCRAHFMVDIVSVH
jgi:hypothetical protein